MTDLPQVSVIIPCRNEEKFIRMCLDSVIENDYPKDQLEVLVVDGMSEDRTRRIVKEYIRRHAFIRMIDNPKKVTPVALNIGVKNAKGEIIMRLDAHAWLEKDYISRCVESLKKHGADAAGGIMKTIPREGGLIGAAIVACLSHRFGVGNSYFRIHSSKPKWVDTVFGGCYRRDVFDRVGLFNENLVRGQDMEFSLRLKKAGGRTLLVPDAVIYYYARSDMKSFWKHNFSNGVWVILMFLYSSIMPVSWRHLVPLAFLLSLIGSAALSFVSPFGFWMLAGIAGTYAIANLAASAQIAVRERDIRHLFIMPVVFLSLHLSYGMGSLWGICKVLITEARKHGSTDKDSRTQ